MKAKVEKKTVAVDFDGVCNEYKGWAGEEELYQPRQGLEDFFKALKNNNFNITIYSTRSSKTIETWLEGYGFLKYISHVTSKKPKAHVYLDDRAVTFNGNFFEALLSIINFQTHWEK